MTKLVSVIMPAYNLAEFINESIKSVQDQLYSNWELIVVDDGSSDDTVAIVKNIASQDNRVKIICQKNAGSAAARNTGLGAAKGEFLAFLDGDDLWDNSFLKEMMAAIQRSGGNMAYCGYAHLYQAGFQRKFSYGYANGNILLDIVKGNTQVHIGCIVVERAVVDSNGLRFTEGCLIGQDQEFIIKLAAHTNVEAVPKELMLYRIRTGSAINSQWRWQKHIHAILGLTRARDYVLGLSTSQVDVGRIAEAFQERISYKVFKFLWRMVKNGNHEDVWKLLKDSQFSSDLKKVRIDSLSSIDRIKYRIVISPNSSTWKMARFFSLGS